MTKGYEDHIEHPPLGAGQSLAPGYEILDHLHQSNNFDVYEVSSEERACNCIAKTPRQDRLEDAQVGRGLLREGRLLKKLTHPHIVRIYETIKEPQPALILEMLTGETLSYLIDNRYRRLPVKDLAYLGLHLCSAVHYLHRHGILHLDLKPSNIVSERGIAKILDLSIARPPGRSKRGAGTVHYMAPEQVRGELVGPATDVWGIGAVLFEAATDVMPFNAEDTDSDGYTDSDNGCESDSESEIGTNTDLDSYEQLHRRADPVRSHRRIPAALADAIDACLDPEPDRRPTVAGLTKTLQTLV